MNKNTVLFIICISFFSNYCLFSQDSILAILSGINSPINCIEISGDEKFLVSGSKDGNVVIWDLTTFEMKNKIQLDESSVKEVKLINENTLLASHYRYVSKIDFPNLKVKTKSKKIHSSFVESLDYSSANQLVSTTSWRDNSIQIINLKNMKKEKIFEHSEWTDVAIFVPDEEKLLSGSHDNKIKLWDLNSGLIVKTFLGHDDWVYDLALSANKQYLFSCSMDNSVKIWDLKTTKTMATLKGHKEGVVCIDLSKDGSLLVSGGIDGKVIIWNTSTFEKVNEIQVSQQAILDVKLSMDNSKVVAAGSDGTIRIYGLKK